MSRRIINILALIGAMLLAGLFGLQWTIDWRVRTTLIQRFGHDYAIIAAHVDGEPRIGFNMLTKVPQLIMRRLNPPVVEGSGGFTGLQHHMVLLVSDNRWVYCQPWSFRAFNLEPDTVPRQIAAMEPSLRNSYMYNENELRLVRGLRVKRIEEESGVSFYWSEGSLPQKGSVLLYSFCRPPYIPPEIIRDEQPERLIPFGADAGASYGARYDVDDTNGESPMVGYRAGEEEWEYAYQYVGMTAGGIHVLRIQRYEDDGSLRYRRWCYLLFVTLELKKTLAPEVLAFAGRDSARQTFRKELAVVGIHGRADTLGCGYGERFVVDGHQVFEETVAEDGSVSSEVVADLSPDTTYADLLNRTLLDCEGKRLGGGHASRPSFTAIGLSGRR